MALVRCPSCANDVSDQASACPKCGHPFAAATPRFKGPPEDCLHCGGRLRKTKEATSSGTGCIIIILGALLAPVLIGIPIILYGIHLMGKRKLSWQCQQCGAQFPRTLKWYELS